MELLVSVIFPLLTVVIGGACILLFSVTTTLRATNGDLTARVELLEKDRARLEQEKADYKAASDRLLAAAGAELEALGRVVTGEAHLVSIIDLLSDHHAEATTHWGHVTEILEHMDTTQATLIENMKGPPE